MPQYLSPGVYVEEVSSGIMPIAGVSTSTAGFIGVVSDAVVMPGIPGKENKDGGYSDHYELAKADTPQLITGWSAFRNHFGNFQAGNKILAHAVYGFFNNGGTRCWVARLAPDQAALTGAREKLAKAKLEFESAKGDAEIQKKTDAVDKAKQEVKKAQEAMLKFDEPATKALKAFETIDEIALVALPGALDKGLQEAAIDHCKKVGDRFAILDGKQTTGDLTPAKITSTKRDTYAALYYPRIQVYDPVSKKNEFIPPSGHIAGVYARVDTQRGVFKSPANEGIRGALGVERRLSKAEQDGLNPAGINVIRLFGNNVTIWGARTLGGDKNGEWKYISARRLFLYLRESIDEGTQWVVFEPNSEQLWAKIRRNITAFLTNVWHAGALFGNTAEEAFYVKCDAETNPPEVRDLGQVVTEIGVALVKPAEFVIFRISQWAGPGE